MEDQIVFPCHNLWGQIFVGFIYIHSCFELQAKGIPLTMAESILNCCKLLTSVEISQGDTNKNVLAEFPSSLRYCATNILTDEVDKTFCPFTSFSVRFMSTENKVEEPLSSSGSFSVDIFSLLSMVGGQGISFDDLHALRTTSLMKVATSFNLSSELPDVMQLQPLGLTSLN